MKGKPRALFAALCCLCLLGWGCREKGPETTPATFTAAFSAAVSSGDETALAAYQGNTYQLNARVDAILPGEGVSLRCPGESRITAALPQEELEGLQAGEVIALEGTVKEVQAHSSGVIEMVLDPAHVVGREFEITGKVEKIFHDWERDGQDYAALWDSTVVESRQVNVYLPQGHGVEEGNTITAQGALTAPADLGELGVGLLPGNQSAAVFLMYEPNSVQKEVRE